MENPQVSGKVFRFLSAMHPALSKAERKKYASYDPDEWYEWTTELAAEFTDLMRRSPRDTSFARGFAYVSQRAVPEGQYVQTCDLLGFIRQLPAAYRSPDGTGFEARIEEPGRASVTYDGMPGFSNVCIAIQGELTQRMQASGAQSVAVKHTETCRVSGSSECRFEIEWSGEAAPSGAAVADAASLIDEELAGLGAPPVPAQEYSNNPTPSAPTGEAARPDSERTSVVTPLHPEPGPYRASSSLTRNGTGAAPAQRGQHAQPAAAAATATLTAAAPAAAVAPAAAAAAIASADPALAEAGTDPLLEQNLAAEFLDLGGEDSGSGDDLFVQLRKRLAIADRQSRMYQDAQAQIESLRAEITRIRQAADAQLAQVARERDLAVDALIELKRRGRSVIDEG